jgi:LytS/YehU family sensor histidine kinase
MNKWDQVSSIPRVQIFGILYLLFFNLNSEGNLYFDRILDKRLPWFYFPKRRLLIQAVFVLVWSALTIGALYTTWYLIKAGKPIYPQFIVFLFFTSVLFLISVMGVSQALKFNTQWRDAVLKAEQAKQAKLQSDYKVLQHQLNPHLLFNSFNVLISEIRHDPGAAEMFARKLSQVYRYVLQSKDHDLIALEKEVDLVRSYVYLHQVRAGQSLDVTIDTSHDALQRYIPPLTLQILVENAIKHNVMNEEHPLRITIETPDRETVAVTNSLNPRQALNSTATGLSNIRARYELLNADGFKIEQNESSFTVTVPLLDE